MTVVRRFAIYLLPYWRHLLAVFLTTGLFVLFSSASYWLAASFLQTLFTGNPPSAINVPTEGIVNTIHQQFKHWTALLLVGETRQDTLVRAAIAIITAFFLKNLFAYLQLHYDSFIEQKVIKDLRDKLFSHLLHQDLAFLHARKRGHLISIILNDVETLNTALNKVFTKLVRDPFNTLFLLVLLLIVNAKLTLIALIIVPSIGWIVLFLSKRIKKIFANCSGEHCGCYRTSSTGDQRNPCRQGIFRRKP